MLVLNFPPDPVIGQRYLSWIWNGRKWSCAPPDPIPPIHIGPIPPDIFIPGDLWLDTTTHQLKIYDDEAEEWVPIGSLIVPDLVRYSDGKFQFYQYNDWHDIAPSPESVRYHDGVLQYFDGDQWVLINIDGGVF